MDLIFNELSIYPLAKKDIEAEDRFKLLLKTFKEANKLYGFKSIKFHSDYGDGPITIDKNFYQWISTISSSHLKNSILTFFKKPYADDLTDEEMEVFINNEFTIMDKDKPPKDNPTGLAVSQIKETLSISLNSHTFWRKRKLLLLKYNGNEIPSSSNITAYNICMDTDLKTIEIMEWADNIFSSKIESEETLRKFLVSSKYQIEFSKEFLIQLFQWKKDDQETFKYTLLLMKDVQQHPFSGGMGKTESLKYRGKEASKQVNQIDRLSYTLENDVVNFLACKGHYNFH